MEQKATIRSFNEIITDLNAPICVFCFRYECVLLRHRFDQNKDIKDLRLAKKLLIDGEMELRNELHPQQLCFPDSPQGPAFDRDFPVPDWIVDYWHPMEKAMYPKYFALREKRKKEYVEFYQKNYLSTAKNEPPSH